MAFKITNSTGASIHFPDGEGGSFEVPSGESEHGSVPVSVSAAIYSGYRHTGLIRIEGSAEQAPAAEQPPVDPGAGGTGDPAPSDPSAGGTGGVEITEDEVIDGEPVEPTQSDSSSDRKARKR